MKKAIINGREVYVWNTNRYYCKEGQRIAFLVHRTLYETGVVFLDYDRQIEGVIPECVATSYDIMVHYDNNNHHPVGNADEYAMVRFLYENKEEILNLLETK